MFFSVFLFTVSNGITGRNGSISGTLVIIKIKVKNKYKINKTYLRNFFTSLLPLKLVLLKTVQINIFITHTKNQILNKI